MEVGSAETDAGENRKIITFKVSETGIFKIENVFISSIFSWTKNNQILISL